jgi:hypothetical protein
MGSASINYDLNSVHCPFCRSHTDNLSKLIVCSDCKTFYHRECWLQNKGCSVFGCAGLMTGLKKRSGEPNWLTSLRVIVFGFVLLLFLRLWFLQPGLIDLVYIIWAILFMVSAPILLITEMVCLFQVTENPEMRLLYGKTIYHILSLSGYGILIFLFLLCMFLLPFMM